LDEQALLATVGGTVTIARLCEEFLADAQENVESKTYDSYRYGCQKFVDLFGTREAHTIEPVDLQRFSRELKASVGDTTRAIILRTIQRCFRACGENLPQHGQRSSSTVARCARGSVATYIGLASGWAGGADGVCSVLSKH
jgi:hypothetical protein